jgi:hypothetical protein
MTAWLRSQRRYTPRRVKRPNPDQVGELRQRHSALRRAFLESVSLDSTGPPAPPGETDGFGRLSPDERLAAQIDSYERALREAGIE